jgi:hypothetical protein
LKQINNGIEGKLFFTDGLRGLEEDAPNPEGVVERWQAVVDAIEPDLIVFDTLSKSHSVDESNNQEIKDVLLQLRKIATVTTHPKDVAGTPEQSGDQEGQRKEIAHVIVHHARKLPGDNRDNYINLDNIRGGSAIRAEADLIFGIFGKNSAGSNKARNSAQALNRTITVEARNFESTDMSATFNGWIFTTKNPARPEVPLEDDDFVEFIKQVFVGMGVRGLGKETLYQELEKIINREREGATKVGIPQIKKMIARLASEKSSEFQVLIKAENRELIAGFPYERVGGKVLYWIRDNSQWLKEPELEKSFKAHKPTRVRS